MSRYEDYRGPKRRGEDYTPEYFAAERQPE